MYFKVALISLLIDRVFGEFSFLKSYKHPVIYIGDLIKFFESKFYHDSKSRGLYLVLFVVGVVFLLSFFVENLVKNEYILAIFGSMTISFKMLLESVGDILKNPQNIKYLVSRDTKDLSESDVYKAGIETLGENLSDGVVAPLFYLLFFGVTGAFVYKAINTLDSMVGYKNDRYKNFGFFSAKLDDVANFIPSRITALLIYPRQKVFKCGKLHESPNAGYPICALAYRIGVRLGGDTKYFGEVKKKPYFGEGRVEIKRGDVLRALSIKKLYDIVLIVGVLGAIFI